MRRMPRATYLWPGLPQLWSWGFGSGLLLATGFAVLLNLLILASFVWVELLSPLHLRLGWLAIGALWAGSAIVSAWHGRRGPLPHGATSAEVLFREALSEYLQESWFEAETILDRLLHLHPRDVEARLLLATLLRHTRRYQEALDQIHRLERLRDADHWAREIAAEKRWIAESQANGSATNVNPAIDNPSQQSSPQAA
jgi:hypothetical protein